MKESYDKFTILLQSENKPVNRSGFSRKPIRCKWPGNDDSVRSRISFGEIFTRQRDWLRLTIKNHECCPVIQQNTSNMIALYYSVRLSFTY